MYNFAIVEDTPKAADLLSKYLRQYAQANNYAVSLEVYTSAESFLAAGKVYDAVFMDIELPGIDGLTCAEKLRAKDGKVIIVFITNISQLAIKGYSVGALDYILKPLVYSDFSFRLERVFRSLKQKSDQFLCIKLPGGMKRLPVHNLIFVEVTGHRITYHFETEDISTGGSFSGISKTLLDYGFLKCNRCYLVNPRYIQNINGYALTVGGYTLTISRPQKKAFLDGVNAYLAKGGLPYEN